MDGGPPGPQADLPGGHGPASLAPAQDPPAGDGRTGRPDYVAEIRIMDGHCPISCRGLFICQGHGGTGCWQIIC